MCRFQNTVAPQSCASSPILCKSSDPVQTKHRMAGLVRLFFCVFKPPVFFYSNSSQSKTCGFFFSEALESEWRLFSDVLALPATRRQSSRVLSEAHKKLLLTRQSQGHTFFLSSLKRSGCIDGGMASMSKSTWKRARKRDFHQCCVS